MESANKQTDEVVEKSAIPGAKVLLLGDSGDGKTHAIRTLVEAGIAPFVIFTEQSQTILGDIPEDKVHWNYIAPGKVGWGVMMKAVKKINTMSFEALTKVQDADRSKYQQILQVMELCNDFVCQRTGEHFGDCAEWGTDRCLVIDSLTGLNQMAMQCAVGSKPVKSPGDWQVAMGIIENLITAFCSDLWCHYVCIAHLEREHDEISGSVKLMASTLGKKLAPKLPKMFDDVIRAEHAQNKFVWHTLSANTSLKTRHLKYANNLPPSYVPLIESWKKRGGIIEVTPTSKL